jgi:AcrR family transcriptional regulator
LTQIEDSVARRSTRKAKGDGYLRRAEILDAAERIFLAEGYDGATIRRIAEEVGVSSTALYMHFPDKAAILMEICERTLTLLLDRNTEIAAKPLDAVSRVRMMTEAYVRWGLAHPSAYNLVYSGPKPSSEIWPEGTTELSHRCFEIFADVVREIAADGRLRTGSADAAAQVFWMSCHGLVGLLTGRPMFPWADTEELITVNLDGLISGLVID